VVVVYDESSMSASSAAAERRAGEAGLSAGFGLLEIYVGALF
jgi:hypothetical protein